MSLNAAATALTSERPRIAPPRVRARFHVWLGLWMLAIVVIGFWPTYFSPLLRGTLTIPTVVHTHALVFLGWMALLMAQVIVAAGGNIRLHRRIGRWGIAYGCVVIVMGLIVGPANAVIKFNSGVWTRDEAARSLLVTVGDMVSFAAWFGAAIWYRARPEVHKRLMVVATVALLFAALARWNFSIASRPRRHLVVADLHRNGARLDHAPARSPGLHPREHCAVPFRVQIALR